ncbi:hypothetical protein VT84_26525 [Gemmata sp. SH-PL17]|nr:hypothetical protein VT84_26525 [Gemmata sp. SH-PL17]
MRQCVLKIACFFVPVVLVVGCEKKEAALPTKLDQPLPKVAGSDGGPKTTPGAGGKKAPTPGAASD